MNTANHVHCRSSRIEWKFNSISVCNKRWKRIEHSLFIKCNIKMAKMQNIVQLLYLSRIIERLFNKFVMKKQEVMSFKQFLQFKSNDKRYCLFTFHFYTELCTQRYTRTTKQEIHYWVVNDIWIVIYTTKDTKLESWIWILLTRGDAKGNKHTKNVNFQFYSESRTIFENLNQLEW